MGASAAGWLDAAFSGFDAWGLRALHALRLSAAGDALLGLSHILALLGRGGVFLILAGLALCCRRPTRRTGAGMLLAVALGFVAANLILKPLVCRARPCADAAGVFHRWWLQAGAAAASGSSFPSGHTTAAMAAATAAFRLGGPKKRWLVFLFPLLMALSRCYLMVHYPSDVLAGLLTGFLAGALAASRCAGRDDLF